MWFFSFSVPSNVWSTACGRGRTGQTEPCLCRPLSVLLSSIREHTMSRSGRITLAHFSFFSPCFFLLLCFFSFFFFFALVAYLFSKFFSSLSLSQCWSKMMRTDRKIWIVSQSRFSALVFPSTKLQERRWDRGYIIDSIYNRAQVLRYINKSLNSHLRIWCRVSK